jgi:hypothetical protein
MEASPRHARVRVQNVRISVGARRHHFDERVSVPFLCECDNEFCHEFVLISLPVFDGFIRQDLVLAALGHPVELGTLDAGTDVYALYRIDAA